MVKKVVMQHVPHRRLNPLLGQWVMVSPHRTKRPWLGVVNEPDNETRQVYDPECYLCPGNKRVGNIKNPEYSGTYVFNNDFAALLYDIEIEPYIGDELLCAVPERGICRVFTLSHRHDLTLATMEVEQITLVIEMWINEFQFLGKKTNINYVQIFENRGEIMGCSNHHPHGQIWASEVIPDLPAEEDRHQKLYFKQHGRTLLFDYISREMREQERIIFTNNTFIALVPFWAVWPFETLIVPRNPMTDISMMSASQVFDLADALHRMNIRFDNLFKTPFPYTMGFHQQPTNGENHDYWHFHIHYYPPLLRSASVRKFMVGYEMLAMAHRDITAEQSAQQLRDCLDIHYKNSNS